MSVAYSFLDLIVGAFAVLQSFKQGKTPSLLKGFPIKGYSLSHPKGWIFRVVHKASVCHGEIADSRDGQLCVLSLLWPLWGQSSWTSPWLLWAAFFSSEKKKKKKNTYLIKADDSSKGSNYVLVCYGFFKIFVSKWWSWCLLEWPAHSSHSIHAL